MEFIYIYCNIPNIYLNIYIRNIWFNIYIRDIWTLGRYNWLVPCRVFSEFESEELRQGRLPISQTRGCLEWVVSADSVKVTSLKKINGKFYCPGCSIFSIVHDGVNHFRDYLHSNNVMSFFPQAVPVMGQGWYALLWQIDFRAPFACDLWELPT